MKNFKNIFTFILFSHLFLFVNSQKRNNLNNKTSFKPYDNFYEEARNNNGIRLVFYNCENFFDIYNDSTKNDDEFTPTGLKSWNNTKFYTKLFHTYKTLISIGGWEPPGIIGLCEIENQFVLNQLIYKTPLSKFNYKIIHYESPDRRGIDVALLYRPKKFKPLFYKPIQINFPFNSNSKTRDILYVKGLLLDKDTLNIFVNHWPSRFGGYMATIPKRKFAASVLRKYVDSLLAINPWSNIVIMGDFNDDPTDESITKTLDAKHDTSNLKLKDLFNLMYEKKNNFNKGTLKYKGNWNIFDQFIVSTALLKRKQGLQVSPHKAQIFKANFLLEEDTKYFGQRLFRTYLGPKYVGGYSDHLPIYLDLIYK